MKTKQRYFVFSFPAVSTVTCCGCKTYEITDRRPGDLAACYADPARSLDVLGWKAEHSLVDMCRDTWNWQKQNPNGYDK